jgi:hypothetical protein
MVSSAGVPIPSQYMRTCSTATPAGTEKSIEPGCDNKPVPAVTIPVPDAMDIDGGPKISDPSANASPVGIVKIRALTRTNSAINFQLSFQRKDKKQEQVKEIWRSAKDMITNKWSCFLSRWKISYHQER